MDITIKYMLRPVALLAKRVAVASPGHDISRYDDFLLIEAGSRLHLNNL